MSKIRTAFEKSASQVIPLELSKLPDVDLYRLDGDTTSMLAGPSVAGWMEAIGELEAVFPGHDCADIACGVFASYVARLSETSEAVFALDAHGVPSHFNVCVLPVAPNDDFATVLQTLAASESHGALETTAVPLAVTKGHDVAPPANTEIHLHVAKDGGITWHHASNIDARAVALIGERMVALAGGIAGAPETPISRQSIMSDRESGLVLKDWNATDKPYAYDGGLIAMMERAAAATPDHPALIYKGETLSFAEFNSRTNRLARVLRDKGVGKDSFVGLYTERSLEMVIALWATMKAGAAYVPLNTEDPAARVNEIIDDCKPVVVLAQEAICDQLDTTAADVIALPDGGDVDPAGDGSDLDIEIGPRDLAYMIYTSGSTGKPKGVTVEHAAIHNRVVWMHEEYGLLPEDRVLQKTPYTFDVSVWEFLWSFSVGSTLVVSEPGGHMAIGYLSQLIEEERVTHLHFVPSVLRMFLILPQLDKLPIKNLFCSGEALGFDLVEMFYGKASATAEIHNLYGPTEAAVDVSYYACPRNPEEKSIPIGKPVANTGLYILDENDQPVPVGVPGELYIGGIQLARGYWAREDLTAERFVDCPVAGVAHDRLYKTGDLAYFRPDGEIMYLGRNDFQVKINGVRMELGEIEAAIRDQEGVNDVVVVAEEQGASKNLVAYVVADDPCEEQGEALKARVAATRPVHYIPKEIRFLADMPLTVSGKVNRKTLAAQPLLGLPAEELQEAVA